MNLSTLECFGSQGLKVFLSVYRLFVFGDLVTIPWLDRQVCLVPDAKKSRGPDDVLFRTKKKETLLHTGQSLFSIALRGLTGLRGTESSSIYLSLL